MLMKTKRDFLHSIGYLNCTKKHIRLDLLLILAHARLDYCKRDDFDFDIVNFPFLDGDVPRSASYGVYISQLIRFARVSSHVDDFNTRNKVLTAKLLRQGFRYHKLRKAFSKFIGGIVT